MRGGIVRLVPALGILLVSCGGHARPSARPTDPPPAVVVEGRDDALFVAAKKVALRTFPDCGQLLTYFRKEAAKRVGPYGLPWGAGYGGGVVSFIDFAQGGTSLGMAAGTGAASVPMAVPAPEVAVPPGAGSAFSGTNVQEAGVDEPDLVKTDGHRILALVGDRLMALAIAEGRPRLAGSLRFENSWGNELLLAGDRLLVIAREAYAVVEGRRQVAPVPWRGQTAVHIVDVSDPAAMRIVKTLWIEGQYVSARMVDGIARVVVRTSGVNVDLTYPRNGSVAATKRAEIANKRAVEATSLADWLPRYAITAGRSFPSTARTLTRCDEVRRPREFSGLEMVSVLTVDPADPTPRETATVVGTGETVYASTTGLYVTTTKWDDVIALRSGRRLSVPKLTTQIHRFDISDPRRARYEASGEVAGSLLNQWSLSEHEGRLRVANTVSTARGGTVSGIDVLEQRGPLLARVGHVGGLGRTERIYAVRFMGDLCYVVTFRQVDPLYVIDLSDPKAPRVRGALKIPGFSSYLHPTDEGRLLGIGQDATDEGQVLGVQASLFDVSDPDDPRRVDRIALGQGYTQVQEDHRAFLWWAPERLALFPLSSYGESEGTQESGVVALRVGDISVRRVARIAHPSPRVEADEGYDADPQIQRALVIGETLYTVSYAGLMANHLNSFDRRAWIAWPTPARE